MPRATELWSRPHGPQKRLYSRSVIELWELGSMKISLNIYKWCHIDSRHDFKVFLIIITVLIQQNRMIAVKEFSVLPPQFEEWVLRFGTAVLHVHHVVCPWHGGHGSHFAAHHVWGLQAGWEEEGRVKRLQANKVIWFTPATINLWLCACKTACSLVTRLHFSHPPEKWVWSTAYSIFVQVCRNVVAHCSFLI